MAKKLSDKEKEIRKNMEVLAISREEAEELYAFDHDEIENVEAEALTEKAEKITKEKRQGSSLDKVRNLKAKKKTDDSKQEIVNLVFEAIKGSPLVVLPQEMTGTKISFMDTLGNYYSATVTKHKAAPDGYKGV